MTLGQAFGRFPISTARASLRLALARGGKPLRSILALWHCRQARQQGILTAVLEPAWHCFDASLATSRGLVIGAISAAMVSMSAPPYLTASMEQQALASKK